MCQRCEKDSELAEKLLEGREEQFNFTEMAKAEGAEFADWWVERYKDLSLFAHPRSPGLQILVSPKDRQLELALGPSFNQDHLLGTVYFQLAILIHDLKLLASILNSKNPSSYPVWGPPAFKQVQEANRLTKKIVEDLDPEGRLAMKEALQAPPEERVSWGEYKK